MTGSPRRAVLLFSGADPSGGAGTHADAQTIAALGAHPLPVITALTVQDNDRVHAVHPVASGLVEEQARALLAKIEIAAVKIGVIGSADNARAIAALVAEARRRVPRLMVVLDPVLASGQGDPLARGNAIAQMATLLPLADLVTPNLPEAAALGGDDGMRGPDAQAAVLLRRGAANVLIKGGHDTGDEVVNRWYHRNGARDWKWPRRAGEFHGSGCTLASAIAALLAQGATMAEALDGGQAFCQRAIDDAYPIAGGQWMLARCREPAAAGIPKENRMYKGLYVVTPDWDDTARMVEVTAQAIAGGAKLVQYRHKTATPGLRREQAAQLVRLCRARGVPMIVNDHVDLCLAVDADGVHVGETDAEVSAARTAVGPDKIVGASCYGRLDLARSAALAGADYIAFGGFYPSRVKQYEVTTQPGLIAEAKSELGVPVCVIGGMTAQNSPPLIAQGADMVAAISAVYMAGDPVAAAREMAALFG